MAHSRLVLDGHSYSSDGFLLLRIRADRVDGGGSQHGMYAIPTVADSQRIIARHMKSVMKQFSFGSSTLQIESATANFNADPFLHPGDAVKICGGPSIGAIGTLVTVTFGTAYVRLLPQPPGQDEAVVEADVGNVRRRFEIGTEVEVKVGELMGQRGLVFSEEGDNIVVINMKTWEEFTVPIHFVDATRRTEPTGSDSDRPYIPEAAARLRFGWPIKILRGKHAGKTGKAMMIEREFIRVKEDVTNLELVVQNNNFVVYGKIPDPVPFVEPTPEQLKEWRSRPKKRITKVSAEDADKCNVDHFKEGFDGKLVYVWRGQWKGRVGVVYQVSGDKTRVCFDSAMQGKSLVDISTSYLIAECGCVLAPGNCLPWTKTELDNIPALFRNVRRRRGNTPPPRNISYIGDDFSSARPTFRQMWHDPSDEGMWLFHEKISRHRIKYKFVVKIESHRDTNVSGLREGRVLSDPHPLTHPFQLTTPPTVLVRFGDTRRKDRVEPLHVGTLRTTSRLKDKGLHVVVSGENVGMIVTHLRTDGEMVRVCEVGKHKSTAFYVEKDTLCRIEE